MIEIDGLAITKGVVLNESSNSLPEGRDNYKEFGNG
jgi:hypothetical protein